MGVGGKIDPALGSLQDNGGPTPTVAPLAGSPVIDQGVNSGGVPTDQRGRRRTFVNTGVAEPSGGDGTDIGAVEIGSPLFVPKVGFLSAAQTFNENSGTFTVTVTLSAAIAEDVTVPFTLGGTAVGGTNYSGVTTSPLVIPAGQTFGRITGTLINDGAAGSGKTLTFTIGSPTNATPGPTTTDTLTITGPSTTFSIADNSVIEPALMDSESRLHGHAHRRSDLASHRRLHHRGRHGPAQHRLHTADRRDDVCLGIRHGDHRHPRLRQRRL